MPRILTIAALAAALSIQAGAAPAKRPPAIVVCNGTYCLLQNGSYRLDPRNGRRVVAICRDNSEWVANIRRPDFRNGACIGHGGVLAYTWR